MIRFILISLSLLLGINAISQTKNLSDYSYVIVPQQFEFLSGKDQYKVNSMTKFYFDKNGFNAYLSDSAPNANRCDGLYANVEELRTVFGTKLQVVLKDCNDNEVFRGNEGKSKYKEHDKSYQDALRKSFTSLETLRVKQKDIVLIDNTNNNSVATKEKTVAPEKSVSTKPEVSRISGNLLPDAKYLNYSNSGKSFLLRKTTEGYSLYEESSSAADGLILKGKVIVMDTLVKYMDTSGNVAEAAFDSSGNLSIKKDGTSTLYKVEN